MSPRNVLNSIDLNSVRFGAPEYLWLLLAPAALMFAWVWQLTARRRDAGRFRRHRRLPVRERFPIVGSLAFWLCLLLAIACTIIALARPTAAVALVRTAGVDLVILQDGSASMRTADVAGNRWQRSMRFLRVLGESLAWRDDRMAMALFAHIAAPQVRLTKDPNTFFFFLDHLAQESPFRLEDDTSWDTNIELGIAWGMRLIEKDQEVYGKSPNAKAFVLISDGQAWSGEVEKSLKLARSKDFPVFVVGVGTTSGGMIPEAARPPGRRRRRDDADSFDAGPAVADANRQRGRRRISRARSGRRSRDREPHHRRGAQARRIARPRGGDRGALLALPARRRGVHVPGPALPAGARGAVAARRRSGRGAVFRLDAHAVT